MAQLIVRKLEDKLVKRLKRRAVEHGISMEEEHRRILKQILETSPKSKPKMSFKEFLVAPPYWDDEFCKIIEKIVEERRSGQIRHH